VFTLSVYFFLGITGFVDFIGIR